MLVYRKGTAGRISIEIFGHNVFPQIARLPLTNRLLKNSYMSLAYGCRWTVIYNLYVISPVKSPQQVHKVTFSNECGLFD
jgi:hypothetical protein